MISTTSTATTHTGNGIASEFSFGFPILEDEDLEVFEIDTDGVYTEYVLDTDYTVSGAGDPSGGSITLLAGALTTDYILLIRRRPAQTQGVDLRGQGTFSPEALEAALDKLTMLIQEQEQRWLPKYTTATRPTAGPLWEGRFILLKDSGAAMRLQTVMQNSDGTWDWETVVVAPS